METPRDDVGREIDAGEAVTTRIGAAALPLGVLLIAISEVFHPSREDPMDFPAVFREYANSDVWYAVDAWVSAPASQKPAAFAAAEAVRWTEIGMNALSYFLAGLSLFLFGLAIALGRAYPRWTGLLAALSGAALMYNGAVEVAYGETLELPVLAQDLRLVEA